MNRENRSHAWPGIDLPYGYVLRVLRTYCAVILVAGMMSSQAVASARGSTESQPSAASLQVDVVDDLVSVRAQNVALHDVLREIMQQCNLSLVLQGQLSDRIVMSFEHLPVHAALKKILRGRSYALRYHSTLSGDSTLDDTRQNTLWVLSDEAGAARVTGVTVTPAEQRRENAPAASQSDYLDTTPSIDALATDLHTVASGDRELVVDALGDIGDARAMQLLEQALRDPEPDVREAAILSISEIGGDEAARALAVALDDNDDSLREEAVDALGEIGGEMASRLLQRALNDEQPFIREAAAGHLARRPAREK